MTLAEFSEGMNRKNRSLQSVWEEISFKLLVLFSLTDLCSSLIFLSFSLPQEC